LKIAKAIHSELIKLKYPPILWLVVFVVAITLVIVFTAYYIDIHKSVRLGVNPWIRVNTAGQTIFAMFVGTPFVILLISAILFIEHQNLGFKQLYALPKRREILLLYKLLAIFLCLLTTIALLIFGLIIIGYSLNVIYPETEFTFYKMPLLALLKSFGSYIISALGIIGIQYFLSVRFKGFLAPASFGILAYVVGFIITSIDNVIALYFPYCYTMIAKENDLFKLSSFDVKQYGILNEIELYSIIVFLTFILLTLYTERKRSI